MKDLARMPVDRLISRNYAQLATSKDDDRGVIWCRVCKRAVQDGDESPSNPHLHLSCDRYR